MQNQNMPTLKNRYICPTGHYTRPEGITDQKCPICGHSLVMTVEVRNPASDNACAMAKFCPGSGPNCLVASDVPPVPNGARVVKDWTCKPSQRWMYCQAYKEMLGLKFNRELGVYLMDHCPCCDANLASEAKRNLSKAKKAKR